MDTVLFTDGMVSNGTTGMRLSLNAPEAANASFAPLVRDGDLKGSISQLAGTTYLSIPPSWKLADSAELPYISRNTSDVFLQPAIEAALRGAQRRGL